MTNLFFKLALGVEACLIVAVSVASLHLFGDVVQQQHGMQLEEMLAVAGILCSGVITFLTYKIVEVLALKGARSVDYRGIVVNKYSVAGYKERIFKLDVRLDHEARALTMQVSKDCFDKHEVGQRIILRRRQVNFLATSQEELLDSPA